MPDTPRANTPGVKARGLRAAPRLGPDELIAPHITRLGRFRTINPTKARPLPRFTQIVAVLGWVALIEETFRRARRLDRAGQAADDVR